MRKLGILLLLGLGSLRPVLAQEGGAWAAQLPFVGHLPTGEDPGPAPAPATNRPPFTYTPPTPVGGRLKGVVEIGASGFNAFIARVDDQRRWKLEKAEYGSSQVLENQATEASIQQGLRAYVEKMLAYGVARPDIHFVVSSGAAQATGTGRLLQVLRAQGLAVSVVTAEQEGALGMRAVLPAPFADHAFLVDMGSGNTKIGWLDHGTPEVVSTYGAKFYQQNLAATAVLADVRAKADQVPADHRQTCFVLGGVPYELARPLRQGQEPYTVLQAPADCPPATEAKQQAGQAIYAALADATGCQQFVFVWDGNFTLGYLLTK